QTIRGYNDQLTTMTGQLQSLSQAATADDLRPIVLGLSTRVATLETQIVPLRAQQVYWDWTYKAGSELPDNEPVTLNANCPSQEMEVVGGGYSVNSTDILVDL